MKILINVLKKHDDEKNRSQALEENRPVTLKFNLYLD